MNIHSPTFLFSENVTERKSRVFVWFANPPVRRVCRRCRAPSRDPFWLAEREALRALNCATSRQPAKPSGSARAARQVPVGKRGRGKCRRGGDFRFARRHLQSAADQASAAIGGLERGSSASGRFGNDG